FIVSISDAVDDSAKLTVNHLGITLEYGDSAVLDADERGYVRVWEQSAGVPGASIGIVKSAVSIKLEITENGIIFTDGVNSVGAQYVADYSTAGLSLGDRWIPDKGAVDALIDTDVAVVTSALAAGTQAVHWDGLTNVPLNIMKVALGSLVYSSETEISIVTLPAGAVVWDIQIYVTTAFDGGVNHLYLGVTGNTDYYVGGAGPSSTILTSTGWKNAVGNIPDVPFTGTLSVIAHYDDVVPDANAGAATIYVWYTLH
ncbi:hypothetical protein LCGC14_2711750, partial [marine sediment metagenome]